MKTEKLMNDEDGSNPLYQNARTNNAPVIPTELWALWNTQTGGWVPTMDESGGDEDPIMVLTNREDAELCARRQNDLYELASVPVRIK